jgi:hypothetical protein
MSYFWPEWARSEEKALAHYVLPNVADSIRLDLPRFDYLKQRHYYDLVRGSYEALCDLELRYVHEPPHHHPERQVLRDPRTIRLGAQEGTCIDLALLFAGLCLGIGLVPLVVIIEGHALVAVSLRYERGEIKGYALRRADPEKGDGPWTREGILTAKDADTLKTLIDDGHYLAVECTGFARTNVLDPALPEGRERIDGRLDFARAIKAGREQLDLTSRPFLFAVDPAVLQDLRGYALFTPPSNDVPRLVKQFDGLFAEHGLFAGRDEELDRLDRLVQPNAKARLLVLGDSGIGKTALLVNWIRRLLGREEREELRVAYHIITRQRSLYSAGEIDVLRNLCQQLMRFRGDADPVPSHRVDLQIKFAEILTNRPWPIPLVVVVDGLDEAEDWTPNTSYHVPTNLPDNIFFIVSARPIADHDWPNELKFPHHDDILKLDALSEGDVALLLRAAGGEAAALADDKMFVKALRAKSDGDPLFLRFAALPDIIARKYTGKEALGAMPQGLAAYLIKWWEELKKPVGEKESVRELIGLLTVARGALTRADLIELDPSGKQLGSRVDYAIGLVARFLVGNETDGYILRHPRFRDFVASRYAPKELDEFRVKLSDFCARWAEHGSRYAIRFFARHLLDGLGDSMKPAASGIIERLVALLADENFQTTYMEQVRDFIELERDMREALRQVARMDGPLAVPIARLALALWEFWRHWLRVDPLLEAARRGELQEAQRRLALFDTNIFWRQTGLLLIVWLGTQTDPAAARAFLARHADELDPDRLSDSSLRLLRERILTELEGLPPRKLHLPYYPGALPDQVDEFTASLLVERLGGRLEENISNLELLNLNRGLLMDVPSQGDAEGMAYLTEREAPYLVAFANGKPEPGLRLLRKYTGTHAGNPYSEYRNRALQGILGAVLCLEEPRHVIELLEVLLDHALRPGGMPYRESLLIVAEALSARAGDKSARASLDQRQRQALERIKSLRGERHASDTWGHHCRRLALLAESYAVALQDDATATSLLLKAGELPYGYAGFQASASLTLAEAVLVAAGPLQVRERALAQAAQSARFIQEPLFCAKMAARVHALTRKWWQQPTPSVPTLIERFVDQPDAEEFASLHLVGDHSVHRGRFFLDFPPSMAHANTLQEIGRSIFNVAMSDLERLNPAIDRNASLSPGTPVSGPDPGLAPLLAQRFAAEALAQRNILGPEVAALIAKLVPEALANETALHLVLARMLLAMTPIDRTTIDGIRSIVPSDWMEETV